MKREASKKSKLWLWLVIGLAVLLVAGGIAAAFLIPWSDGDADATESTGPLDATGGRPELYWNVDRAIYTKDAQTSTREPGEDGAYKIRFAYNGTLVEKSVADKKLVNYIDTLDAMGLVLDDNGLVVDAVAPKEIAKEIAKNAFVKTTTSTTIEANTSVAMNGLNIKIKMIEGAEIYDVTPEAEVPGQVMNIGALKPMDTLTVYGDADGNVTHVFVTSHARESKVYWRADQFYNSTEKSTTREPDENGVYTVPFFCEGEVVELKFKDKTLVTKIDSISRWKCHFGLTFDESGYVVEQFVSSLGISGLIVADCWDVVDIQDDTYTIQRLTTNDGSVWTGTIPAGTPIYEAGIKAKQEGEGGRQVESLQMGDRVTVWTDTTGNVILVYVAERIVDCPAYWIPTRKYKTAEKTTTREIGPSGYYEIELIKEGSNKKEVYYVKDKETMSYIDSQTSKIVGLETEGKFVKYAYGAEALTGYTTATRGGVVTKATGTIITKITYGKRGTDANLILAPNAKVYNVSGYGTLGAETTVREGDHIYAQRQPTGELVLVYVTKRTIGGNKLYWNYEQLWDKTNLTSTRVPDAEGWYYFDMAHKGKKVTLKTQNKELVDKIDKLSIGATALDVNGDVITNVYDAGYAYGGNKVASGYKFQYITKDGKYFCTYASDANKTVEFTMAEDCVIYNVSPVFDEVKGERIYSIPKNSMLTVFCDIYGEAKVVYVRSKAVKDMYWKTEILYDSSNKVTKRTPDADGYYWFNLAVNGECKAFKTKDQKIANSMDSYAGAFGLNVKGDEIFGFVSTSGVVNVSGNGFTTATITAINGRTITVETSKGKETMKLSSDVKIYDVSPSAENFGAVATLNVGDVVRTYLNSEKTQHNYVYIKARPSRVNGEVGYCSVCQKEVKWQPMSNSTAITAAEGHWYVPADMTQWVQSTFASTAKDYTVCLDLNGKVLTRAENGRNFRVSDGEVLNIMDSVGGGKIVTHGGTSYNGGMFMIGGGSVVNVYGGTLEYVDTGISNGYGGIVYMSGAGTTFNLYDGVITGGVTTAHKKDKLAYGGNFYLAAGATLNMYAGEISNGVARGILFESPDKDGNPTYTALAPYGGNIYLTESSNVNIYGGVVKDGHAVRETFTAPDGKEYTNMSYGGNIYKVNTDKLNGKLYIKDATVSGGQAHRGGNIFTSSGSAGLIELDNATIIEGTVSQFGGNIMSIGGQWTITKSRILDGKVTGTGSGGNIYSQGGVFGTVTDTVISGGNASSGGNIYLYKNKTDENGFVVGAGTVIENGVATGEGGNIYLKNKNYVKLADGSIVAPADDDGTGEAMLPVLMLAGGEVKNGQGTSNIYTAGHMSVQSGKISGGNIKFAGEGEALLDIAGGEIAGEFLVENPKDFTMSGAPVIEKLNLGKNVLINVGTMTDGASVAVITTTSVFTNSIASAKDYLEKDYFVSADPAQQIQANANNELMLKGADLNEVYEKAVAMSFSGADADGNVTAECPVCRKSVQWSVLPANPNTTSMKDLENSHYYLSETVDYTQNKALYNFTTGKSVCLHLNGQNMTSTERAFYTEKNGTVLNVMGDGVVTGAAPGRDGKGSMRGVFDLTTNANFCGGTYISTTENPAIGNRKTSSGEALVSIYAGTKIINENPNGVALYAKANGGLDICGGTITGRVLEEESKGITVSGTPVINYMDLTGGTLLNVGALETGASITVAADGIFTNELSNAEAAKSFFKGYDGMSILVDGNALSCLDNSIKPNDVYEAAKAMDFTGADADGKVIAVCPVCGEEVEWNILPAVTTGTSLSTVESGHYYLSSTVDYTQNTGHYNFTEKQVCINLNGQNITSAGRAFYTEKAATLLNIMGEGTVSGQGTAISGGYRAVLDLTASANLYGGTYISTVEGAPAIENRASTHTESYLSIYAGTTVINTEGGKAVVISKKGNLNIHAGTIGTVYNNESTGEFTIDGAPVIEKLDLSNDKIVEVGTLTEGASIYVEAEGVFTSAIEDAAAAKEFFTVAEGKKLAIAGDALSVIEDAPLVCPHCGLTEAELEAAGTPWTEWTANYGSSYKGTIASGHYYLTESVTGMNGYYYIGTSTDDDVNELSVDVVLDLRGNSLQSTTRVFYGYTNNHLTLWDSVGGSSIQGGLATSGGGVAFFGDGGGNASLNLYNITVKDGATATREKDGGIFYLSGNTNLYMENCTVVGATAKSGVAVYVNSGEAVIKNSTITGGAASDKGGSIYLGSGSLTLENTTVSGGTASKGADIYVTTGTLNVTDSSVGNIWMQDAGSNIVLNGVVVIGKLDLTNADAKATVGELSEGASITVAADGVFTNALTDAEAVKGYFISGVSGKQVLIQDNALAIAAEAGAPSVYEQAKAMDFSAGGTVNAVCPVCGVAVDWLELPAISGTNNFTRSEGVHHYYLSDKIDYTGNTKHYLMGGTASMCLNLNGQTMVSTTRALIVDGSTAKMNVMGDGLVKGASLSQINRGVLDTTGEMNLYGGTYECTNSAAPVLAIRGSKDACVTNIYEGTVIRRAEDAPGLCVYLFDNGELNLYGGVITGGNTSADDAVFGGNIWIVPNTKATTYTCELNVMGGVISNGVDAVGGNIYVTGSDAVGPTGTVNISGGEIIGGAVYATGANAVINISGNPVVDYLEMAAANLVNVADMTEGASVKVAAGENVPFTTEIAANADEYAKYFYGEGQHVGAVAVNNALQLAAVCPHCGVALADITWTEVVHDGEKYTFPASGHYKMTSDLESTGNTFTFSDATATTGLDVALDTCGFDINSKGRVFYVAKYNKLTVFDSVGGTVATSISTNSGLGGSGLVAYTNAEANIYDITLNGSADANGKGNCISVYATSTVVNIYSGTFNGTDCTTSGNNGGTVYNHGTLNIYGGTFSDAELTDALGGCLYSDGTLNIADAELNGDVYIAAGETAVSGATKIADLQIASGIKVTLSELADGADITVKADGEFTEANAEAETYVTNGWVKAAVGSQITVTEGIMSMVAVAMASRLLSVADIL